MPRYENKYHLQWWMKIFAAAFTLLLVVTFRPWLSFSGVRFWFNLLGTPLLIVMFIGSLFVRYIISAEGSQAMIGPFTIRKVRWGDIREIYDDHFGGVHLYTFLTSKRWHRRYFGYNNACTYYKDFLCESVSRVRPDTKVEDKVLALIGFTERDIGKNYKRNITG